MTIIPELNNQNNLDVHKANEKIIRTWFLGQKKIELVLVNDTELQQKIFDLVSEKMRAISLKLSTNYSIERNIEYYRDYHDPILRPNSKITLGQTEKFYTIKNIGALEDKEVFLLFAESLNAFVCKIHDKVLEIIYFVPLSSAYVFHNEKLYEFYNHSTLGKFTSNGTACSYESLVNKQNIRGKFVSITSFTKSTDIKKISNYFDDCEIIQIKVDQNSCIAIKVKKIIAESFFKIYNSYPPVIVDSNRWLVSYINSAGININIRGIISLFLSPFNSAAQWAGHAVMITEGIQNGHYFMRRADLIEGEKDPESTLSFGEVRSWQVDPNSIRHFGKIQSWIVKKSLVESTLRLIQWEIDEQNRGNPLIYYHTQGYQAKHLKCKNIKQLNSREDFLQTILDYFRNKKRIMNIYKPLVVCVSYVPNFIRVFSFIKNKNWILNSPESK